MPDPKLCRAGNCQVPDKCLHVVTLVGMHSAIQVHVAQPEPLENTGEEDYVGQALGASRGRIESWGFDCR